MGKKRVAKFMLVLLCCVFLIGLTAGSAVSQQTRQVIKLRVTAGHPISLPYIGAITDFFVPELKKRVLAQTKNYQIECEELYAGSLAKLGEELEAVESGMADISNVVTVFEMAKLYLHNFSSWFPFSSADVDQVVRVSHLTYDKFPILDQTFERYKQKRLAFGVLGSYGLVTTFPIRTLEDMKGKRIAHGGPMVPWFKAIGAVGVQSRLNEAYTCLQTGVYEGWAMEPNSVVGLKMYEPAPYYTLAGLGAIIPQTLNINLKTFNKLPKEVQDIVIQVGKEYENVVTDGMKKDFNDKVDFMRRNKTTIYKLPEAERVRWATTMNKAGIANSMAKEADRVGFPGTELARFYVKALGEDGYKWPCVPTIK